MTMFAYVGGYTTPDRDGRGPGITAYRVAPHGAWTLIQTVGDMENPSLFTLTRDQTRLYSVHGARNLISALAIDRRTGMLTLLNQVDCQGTNPVDSALDPSERFLVVANYGTGAVAVVPLDPDGRLQPVRQVVPLSGTPGPNPTEQSSSHPHAVIFDPTGTFVIVPDKGFDRTFCFHFAHGNLTPTQQGYVRSAPGAAPRHAAFHPVLPILYVNNELDSTVTVFAWTACRAVERQVITTRTADHPGPNTTAEIAVAPDGACLYVSNRGEDSIAQFVIAADSGLLSYAATCPAGGRKPRFFAFGPGVGQLSVANQDSDSITGFRIDQATGRLVSTGLRVSVGSPSAISFVTPS